MLFLTDKEIETQYKMKDAINDVKKVLEDLRQGKIITKERTVIPLNDNDTMLYMPCVNTASKHSIIKTISIFPSNQQTPVSQGVTLITELETGKHVATLESSYLTRLRTGAMSGIATEKLAPVDSNVLGVIGTGGMAFEQVLGVLEVRNIKIIQLYNRTLEKAEQFKEKLEDFGVICEIIVCKTSKEAVNNADIINCATKSEEKVFHYDDLKEHVHINGVGSYLPNMREIDEEAIAASNIIVFDDMHGAKEEAGEFIHATSQGQFKFDSENVYTLDCIDTTPSRDGITIFKSVGAAYYDLAVAVGTFEKIE